MHLRTPRLWSNAGPKTPTPISPWGMFFAMRGGYRSQHANATELLPWIPGIINSDRASGLLLSWAKQIEQETMSNSTKGRNGPLMRLQNFFCAKVDCGKQEKQCSGCQRIRIIIENCWKLVLHLV